MRSREINTHLVRVKVTHSNERPKKSPRNSAYRKPLFVGTRSSRRRLTRWRRMSAKFGTLSPIPPTTGHPTIHPLHHPVENLPQGRTRDEIGKLVGVSGKSVEAGPIGPGQLETTSNVSSQDVRTGADGRTINNANSFGISEGGGILRNSQDENP